MSQEAMSEEYRKFAEGALGMRRVTLQFMKLNPQPALSLFKQVYQYDPDPELRQLAFDVLRSQGVTPMQDGEPVESTSSDYSSASSPTPISSTPSALRDAGIGGIKADDALSRGEERVRRALAADNEDSPAPGRTTFVMTNSAEATGIAIDGGSGRPVQRGEQNASVFTLNRGNFKYLTGKTDRLASGLWGYAFGLGMSVVFLGIIFFAAIPNSSSKSSEAPPWALIIGFFILFDVLLAVMMVRAFQTAKNFHENGQLLLGQISSANGRWVTTGSGKSRSRSYKVTVNYRVRLPSGGVLDGSSTETRGDLARGGVPDPGTPVAVLVMPDTKKMRLL